MLEPHQLAVEHRVRPARHVAGGDDAGRGEQRLVAHDAVVEREPRALQPVGDRHDADAHDHDVGVDRGCRRRGARARPCRRPRWRRRRRRGAGRRRGRGAAHRTPCRASRPRPRTSGAGSASSTVTCRPRTRHVAATSEPMKPGADHDDARAARRGGRAGRARRRRVRSTKMPSRSGVLGERARRGAGREQRAVERRAPRGAVAGSRVSTLAAASSAVARTPEPQLERRARRSRRAAQRQVLGLPLAGEQLLRERRTVVRQVRLGSHQHDPAVEAVPAQRLRGPQPRQRGPHHHHGPQRRRRPLLRRRRARADRPSVCPRSRPERASTPVQGGRTRVDGTALTGCPGARPGREPGARSAERLSTCDFRVSTPE